MIMLHIFFLCISQITLLQAQALNSVVPVRRLNLSMFTFEDEEWPNNSSFSEFLDHCMKTQTELQPFKKRKAAWNILERYYKYNNKISNHVIGNNRMTWQNLQLLAGQEDDPSLYVANSVSRASTELGRVTLFSWIAQPIDDCKELQRRQACVKFLLEHEDFFNQLDSLLEDFKQFENLLLSFWFNDPLKQAATRNYFKFSKVPAFEQYCNESSAILSAGVVFDHQRRIMAALMAGCAAASLPIYGTSRIFSDYRNVKLDSLVSSGGPVFGWISWADNNLIQSLACIASGVYCGFQFQDQSQWAKDNFKLNMCLQEKLHCVAQAFNTIKKTGCMFSSLDSFTFQNKRNLSQAIEKFVNCNAKSQKLMKLLDSRTFQQESSVIANWGEILVAYRLMNELTCEMEGMLCVFAELDAYMSIARFYKECQRSNVPCSFACYNQDSLKPEVSFSDLWNPLLDKDIAVANSISLGGKSDIYNLIITGPNEAGKSTFVKAVAIGVVLAQSIGIVPAAQATITPFSYITTYLNITDQYGKSLFEAQVDRIKAILDHIDAMDNSLFSFVIIDELFNGTDARVGQAASYSVADYLSKKSQVISIFPTHFPELVLLENNGNSVNYKVSAVLNSAGKITYPFIVEKGISTQNIVLDIMRNENFNDTIIQQTADRLACKK